MSEKKYITSEEFKVWTEHLIKKIPCHETAPETEKMISSLSGDIKSLHAHFEDKNGIKGIIPRIEEQTTKHNGRLRKLEMKYWVASGAIIILGWVSGLAIMEVKDWTQKIESNSDKILLIDSYFEK